MLISLFSFLYKELLVMKNKTVKLLLGLGLLSLLITGCGQKREQPAENNGEEQEQNDQIYEIYKLYASNGGQLSYEEWLQTIKGAPGADGLSLLTGNGLPNASLGKDGDSYIDFMTWNYYIKANGSWTLKGCLKGAGGSSSNEASDLAFYPKDDGTYGVGVGNSLLLSNIVIPETYNGAAVTEIIEQGFSNLKKLSSITLPVSVTAIGDKAFSFSENLSNLIYTGTTIQWEKVSLGNSWNRGTKISLAQCSDGNYILAPAYDSTVLANPDSEISYHAVGGFEGSWMATDLTKMSPTSVDNIANHDTDLADILTNKPLQYLYYKQIEINHGATWVNKAMVNGEVVEFNGGHTVKVIEAIFDREDQVYANNHWITTPADVDAQNAEALTDNIFIPPYQKEQDANGFCWADNPVITSQNGKYLFVLAKYTYQSSERVAGWGFGAIYLG